MKDSHKKLLSIFTVENPHYKYNSQHEGLFISKFKDDFVCFPQVDYGNKECSFNGKRISPCRGCKKRSCAYCVRYYTTSMLEKLATTMEEFSDIDTIISMTFYSSLEPTDLQDHLKSAKDKLTKSIANLNCIWAIGKNGDMFSLMVLLNRWLEKAELSKICEICKGQDEYIGKIKSKKLAQNYLAMHSREAALFFPPKVRLYGFKKSKGV